MKLIYVTNTRLPSEQAHSYQTIKMCEALAANGIEVVLCYPNRRQSLALMNKDLFKYYGVKPIFNVQIIGQFGIISSYKIIYLIQNLIWSSLAYFKMRKLKPDYFYTRDIIIVFWFSLLGLPTIYEEHLIQKSRLARTAMRIMAKKESLKLVIVLTNSIKKDLIALGFSDKRVLVLPDAADLGLFENLPEKNACRKKLNLPQEKIIIGYIGRFRVFGHQEKGLPQLIEAVAKL